MKLAPVPADEAQRMAGLTALNILDTPREPRFDHIADLAAAVFEVPRVFITLVDSDRMWFKATSGVGDLESAPRDVGFCSHTILEPEALVIPDAAADERFSDNPFVTGEFNLGFYAGVPIRGSNGEAVGAVALVDTQPRELSDKQLGLLKKFAALVEIELQR
jgi:GAF domain-containing protein